MCCMAGLFGYFAIHFEILVSMVAEGCEDLPLWRRPRQCCPEVLPSLPPFTGSLLFTQQVLGNHIAQRPISMQIPEIHTCDVPSTSHSHIPQSFPFSANDAEDYDIPIPVFSTPPNETSIPTIASVYYPIGCPPHLGCHVESSPIRVSPMLSTSLPDPPTGIQLTDTVSNALDGVSDFFKKYCGDGLKKGQPLLPSTKQRQHIQDNNHSGYAVRRRREWWMGVCLSASAVTGTSFHLITEEDVLESIKYQGLQDQRSKRLGLDRAIHAWSIWPHIEREAERHILHQI
jgi:hypothetical protein